MFELDRNQFIRSVLLFFLTLIFQIKIFMRASYDFGSADG